MKKIVFMEPIQKVIDKNYYRPKRLLYVKIAGVLAFFSFSSYIRFGPSGVYQTLYTSGPNRPELERVLEHYRSTGDAERYRAACFLVENMRGRYTLSGPSLDKYYAEMARFYEHPGTDYFAQKAFQDSLFASEPYFSDLEVTPDARSVSAEYLISRIESAFSVRNSPWAADLGIEEFCEYVLPYRCSWDVACWIYRQM